jgi:hypothetical protein
MMGVMVAGLALAGPAIHDDSTEASRQLSEQCTKVGKFAQAIATIKATGVAESDFEHYISQPIIQSFPITLIRHQVYASNMRPTDAFQIYYERCLVVGYDNILQSMKDADELVNLREENRTLKSQLAQKQDQLNQLQRALDNQPVRTKEVLVPTYGTPIENH